MLECCTHLRPDTSSLLSSLPVLKTSWSIKDQVVPTPGTCSDCARYSFHIPIFVFITF
jgi:hypothetical protein